MALVDTPAVRWANSISEIKGLIAEVGSLSVAPETIPDTVRVFEGGLGLNSLQGIELLVRIEDRFRVRINNLDWSVHEAQTVEELSRYVLGLAPAGS